MSLGPSEDQQSLVALADETFARRTAGDQLAALERSTSRVDDEGWREAADAGLLGIAVPEEHGGAGLGLVELLLVLEQQGRRLAMLPLWETALAGLALGQHGTGPQHEQWLPRIAGGRATLTVALDLVEGGVGVRAQRTDGGWRLDGLVATVPHGHAAGAVVVEAEAGGQRQLFLVDITADGVRREPVETTTHALAADLTFAGAPAEPLGDAGAVGWLHARARLALAALALGVADGGVHDAAAYVSSREQFGRPLATFQAVSQQVADCYCDVQAMRMTLWQAAWAVEHHDDARAAVGVATWWATDAGLRVQHRVQHLHGGMGADTTYPVHRRFLWAMEIDALLGGASCQLAHLGPRLIEA
ncbi:MAG TPA: acyl-CoA dehydrogenase family protein [Mycobacteriales bacterium]|nr:acyl-CoA dehydrogenase family protein [Mycobacteriales bacterium]